MREHYSILVVDDDSEIVNILQTSLQNAGYQTYTAYNGDEACQLAERLHPHLIIMDVMMPQLGSTQVFHPQGGSSQDHAL